ncbi:methyl-accepting chemotaxis protein [Pseudomonas sp. NPDC007930]|uniref:methyl-accepting chemotaxis protein n=1 Tax=Pseudomonas sp. NPDC007930 TaxID=3364417 RepID=UPI0036E2B216
MHWLRNLSLKYKFWAVNAVAFVTTCLLVLYAVHLEQQALARVAQPAPGYAEVFFNRLPNYAVAVLLLMLLLLAASQLLIRFLLAQLNTLRDVMVSVERSGDLNARVAVAGADEVGQMASAFNALQAGYGRVVGTVASTAGQLDTGAASLAASMGQVRQGMLGQQSETEQAATAIQQMTSTVQHIAEHAKATRELSERADQLTGSGQQAVARVSESIAGLSGGVQQTAEMIQHLAQDSEKITSVVNVIHSIAEQTNLLALNAAIEAARAGDMGRGFAVVADEVRNLAKRVQTSTDEITTMVGALQAGTRDAVDFMRDSSIKADACVEQASEAGGALASIAGAVRQMRDSNTQIAVAAQQQAQVAEDMSRSVLNIRQVTEHTVQQTQGSAATSDELAVLAAGLNRAIGQLRL